MQPARPAALTADALLAISNEQARCVASATGQTGKEQCGRSLRAVAGACVREEKASHFHSRWQWLRHSALATACFPHTLADSDPELAPPPGPGFAAPPITARRLEQAAVTSHPVPWAPRAALPPPTALPSATPATLTPTPSSPSGITSAFAAVAAATAAAAAAAPRPTPSTTAAATGAAPPAAAPAAPQPQPLQRRSTAGGGLGPGQARPGDVGELPFRVRWPQPHAQQPQDLYTWGLTVDVVSFVYATVFYSGER